METPPNLLFIFIISLSFFFFSLSPLIHAAFSPVDHYLINCGSPQTTTIDVDHRRFTGDSSHYGSRFLSPSSSSGSFSISSEDSSNSIYHTARVFTAPSKYVFKIKDQGTTHLLVRLHFYPIPESNQLDDCHLQFHVSANGYVLLYNFTPPKNPIIKDFIVSVDLIDHLEITFTPSKHSKLAFVNAIEVISAPKNLIADVAYTIGSDNPGVDQVNGIQKKAFQTSYRVNVGGVQVTPYNDSLWRSWNPDDQFLKSFVGSDRIYFGSRINYRPGGSSREICPDNVYNSARVIRSPETNITWVFPVDSAYDYLIRLHFCDIASLSIGTIHFNVYINGKLAYYNLDLSERTNWRLASPLYADFLSPSTDESLLSISVGASNASMRNGVDGILNGIEIMKMSNRMGSLDGNVCAGSILKRWHESSYKWNVIPVIAAACLLVTVSMAVVHRRRAWFGGDTVAWSRLPTTTTISELNLKTSSI